ncbi:MAG: Crp/Fnr family transcriptional regulator [Christensenellaceae bacterium]
MEWIDVLSKNKLFEGMKEDTIWSMLSCLGYTLKKYKKGSFVWQEESPIDAIGILISGQVQLIKDDFLGKRSIVSVINAGEMFGEAFVCAGLKNSPVSVLCSGDSEILFLKFEKILKPCQNACVFHVNLIERLMRTIAQKNVQLNGKLDYLCKRTIREKLTAYLLSEHKKQKSNPFLVDFNRNELADFLCVDRSAMSRELSKMKQQKLIDYWKNSFKIINFDQIKIL